MSEPILLVDNITAGYERQRVLRNLSLEVPDGSAVGIIGPNGHGKSTLLKCISNLIRPFHGTIQFKGKSTIGLRPEKIVEIGITHIPQGDLLFPKLTVLENLRMGAYLSLRNGEEVNKRRNQVYEIFPKLREREYQLASTLSGGERRMLSIGRGLMTEGSILLIDEPSLGLAPTLVFFGFIRIIPLLFLFIAIRKASKESGQSRQFASKRAVPGVGFGGGPGGPVDPVR
mgnify:CR=1 FL=1